MSILNVARLGHPALRQRAVDVPRDDLLGSHIQRLIDDMLATMDDYRTLGLSAPQVHEKLRIIVATIPVQEDSVLSPMVLVNPTMIVHGSDVLHEWEGCASLPEVRGSVSRARSIEVRGFDRKGAPIHLRLSGLAARVIQHEIDHLDGLLFVDRMKRFESLVFREYAPPQAALI